jgi:hypothetical protein
MTFHFGSRASRPELHLVAETYRPGTDDPKILSTGGHAFISKEALQPYPVKVAGRELFALFGHPCVFSRSIGSISQGDLVIPVFGNEASTPPGIQKPTGFVGWSDLHALTQPDFVANESLNPLDVIPVAELIINHGKELCTNVHIGLREQDMGIPVEILFTKKGESIELMDMKRLLLAELRDRFYPDLAMPLSALQPVSTQESLGPLICHSLHDIRRILDLHLDLYRRDGLEADADNAVCTEEGCPAITAVFETRHGIDRQFEPHNYRGPEHHTDEMILRALHRTGEYDGSLVIRGFNAIEFSVRSLGDRFSLSYGDFVNDHEQKKRVAEVVGSQLTLSEATLTLEVKPQLGEPLVAFSPKRILETLAADTSLCDRIVMPPEATPIENFRSSRSSVIASMIIVSGNLPLIIEVRTSKENLLADSHPGSNRIYGLVTPGGDPTQEVKEWTVELADTFRIPLAGTEFSGPAKLTIKPDAYEGRNARLLTLVLRPVSERYQAFLPEQVQAALSLRDKIFACFGDGQKNTYL